MRALGSQSKTRGISLRCTSGLKMKTACALINSRMGLVCTFARDLLSCLVETSFTIHSESEALNSS